MALPLIMLVAITAVISIFYGIAGKKYQTFIQLHSRDMQLVFMAPVSLAIIEKLNIMDRFAGRLMKLHHKIVSIYGSRRAYEYTRMFIAQCLSFVLIILLLFSLLSMLSRDSNVTLFGLIFAVIVPLLLTKELNKRIKKRRQAIIMELPEFLNRITLLVNAGETVQKAIIRCAEQKKDSRHPLYSELTQVASEIKNNISFSQSMEEFSKRCGMQEVSIFVTTVLMNYRRGGEEFVLSLRELSRNLWEKRKAMSKTLGEEASSKLVFPLMLVFLVVMVIVAAPAFMQFDKP
jgi:tight adherence protein C